MISPAMPTLRLATAAEKGLKLSVSGNCKLAETAKAGHAEVVVWLTLLSAVSYTA